MQDITLPGPELDLDTYTQPSPESRAMWAQDAAKFSTKSGHVPHQVRPTAQRSDGVLPSFNALPQEGTRTCWPLNAASMKKQAS